MNTQFLWARLLPDSFIKNLSTLWSLGYVGKMPGTLGSFVGLIYYTVLFFPLGTLGFLFWLAVSLYLAVVICQEAEQRFMQKDPSYVILDELVAMPLCFLGLKDAMFNYPMWMVMLAGFFLFRFFDILKPLGIKKIQELKGGVGVVADDVAAALATCTCLHVALYFLER